MMSKAGVVSGFDQYGLLTGWSYLRRPETPALGTIIDSKKTDISRWHLVARGKKINCSGKNGWRRGTDK